MRVKLKSTYKGTNILLTENAKNKRDAINDLINVIQNYGFCEVMIPIIQLESTFRDKVGEENNNLMYTFVDRGNRNLCLAPEYTAIVQQLSQEVYKYNKDVKLFYIAECFRGEKPQAGRYRQFTQFGVEILNPTKDYSDYLINVAKHMISRFTFDFNINKGVTRGLDYYKEGKGFEISCPELGAQSQICGGGEYEGGIGFAIGLDRLLLLNN